MSQFELHPQLLQDCHRLGRMTVSHLLLHRNAAVPWFILVPETEAIDLLDLDADLRNRLLDDATSIARFVKTGLRRPKVNVAAIGNLVPQLHVHVIGRAPDDPCWPLPVWGHLQTSSVYADTQVQEISAQLERSWGLQRPR